MKFTALAVPEIVLVEPDESLLVQVDGLRPGTASVER